MKSKMRLTKRQRAIVIPVFYFVVVLLVVLLLGKQLLAVIVALVLILLGCFSLIWKRFLRLSLGIELITFATVIFALKYDLIFAILAALAMVFVSNYLIGRLCPTMLIPMISYALVALLAVLLPGDVTSIGKICTIVGNIVLHFIYVFIARFRIENSLLYFVINVILNFWLFTTVAPFVIQVV